MTADRERRRAAVRKSAWGASRETVETAVPPEPLPRVRDLRSQGFFEEALGLIEGTWSDRRIKREPQILIDRSLCNFGLGETKKALLDLARAEKLLAAREEAPSSVEEQAETRRMRMLVHLNLASIHNYHGEHPAALSEAEHAVSYAPPELRWMAGCSRVIALTLLGEADAAIEEIRRTAELSGSLPVRVRREVVEYLSRNVELADVRKRVDLHGLFEIPEE